MEDIEGNFTQDDFDRLQNELFKLKMEERLENKDHSKRIKEIKDRLGELAED